MTTRNGAHTAAAASGGRATVLSGPHKLEDIEVFAHTLVHPMYQCEVGIIRIAESVSTSPIEGGVGAVEFSFNELYAHRDRVVDESTDMVFLSFIIACSPRDVAQLLYGVRLA